VFGTKIANTIGQPQQIYVSALPEENGRYFKCLLSRGAQVHNWINCRPKC